MSDSSTPGKCGPICISEDVWIWIEPDLVTIESCCGSSVYLTPAELHRICETVAGTTAHE